VGWRDGTRPASLPPLHPLDRLHVLYMIPAGGAEMLRQAIAMADGGSFEEWKGRKGERG
jgi:hypothetical protein